MKLVFASKKDKCNFFTIQMVKSLTKKKKWTIVLLLLKIYTISIPVNRRESDEYSMFHCLITFKIWTKPLNTSFNPLRSLWANFIFLSIITVVSKTKERKKCCQVLIEKKEELVVDIYSVSKQMRFSHVVREFFYLN